MNLALGFSRGEWHDQKPRFPLTVVIEKGKKMVSASKTLVGVWIKLQLSLIGRGDLIS